MNKSMIDILACPIDKNHPLELFEINQKDNTVSEGALFCPKCSRFYPIIEEIPISSKHIPIVIIMIKMKIFNFSLLSKTYHNFLIFDIF